MNDREMLELAARAAGYKFDSTEPFEICVPHKGGDNYFEWNPLTDDGDALRLAVDMRLDISWQLDNRVEVINQWEREQDCRWSWEAYGTEDARASTRRAIVGTAAKIGKAMLTAPAADPTAPQSPPPA